MSPVTRPVNSIRLSSGPLAFANIETKECRLMQQCELCARYTKDGDNIPSGNRDPETGMDNFVCWHCECETRGAFMLTGRPAEKRLAERQHQMELELAVW